MKGDRKRQPVKTDYTNALGQAAFCFALYEWNVVWCCEKIKPGSANRFTAEELTAGQIGKQFRNIVKDMPRSSEREQLKRLADKFLEFVTRRNAIMHGKPCTGPNGDARLHSGRVIEISDLEDAADRFSECSIELNGFLHGFLASFEPP